MESRLQDGRKCDWLGECSSAEFRVADSPPPALAYRSWLVPDPVSNVLRGIHALVVSRQVCGFAEARWRNSGRVMTCASGTFLILQNELSSDEDQCTCTSAHLQTYLPVLSPVMEILLSAGGRVQYASREIRLGNR